MTGANSAVGLRSLPARYLFLDEARTYDKGVLQRVDKRTRSFTHNYRKFIFSTPKDAGDEFDTDVLTPGLTFDCTGGRYPFIATPSAWGEPDYLTVDGFVYTDFTVEAITFTNASGYSAGSGGYNLLRFNGIQTSSQIVVVIWPTF